jgi:hypothetical protein
MLGHAVFVLAMIVVIVLATSARPARFIAHASGRASRNDRRTAGSPTSAIPA